MNHLRDVSKHEEHGVCKGKLHGFGFASKRRSETRSEREAGSRWLGFSSNCDGKPSNDFK